MVTKQKPKVLGLYDGLDNGCSYYRLISPFAQLAQMGRVYDWLGLSSDKELREAQNKSIGANYEMVTLLRPIVVEDGKQDQPVDEDNVELIEAMIDRVHGAGALFGGDLDDDMWAVEAHNPAHKAMGDYTADRIRYTVQRMDFMTCSTPFLRQRLIEVCGLDPQRVTVVPNLIDFDLYERADWMLDAPSGKPGEKVAVPMQDVRRRRLSAQGPDNRPVTIGIQGGLSHIEDWRQVAPSLKRIAEKYGDRVRFIVAGGNFDYLKEALQKPTEAGLVWWKGWTPFLEHSETVMQFDINLCPLLPTLFNRSKSAIKWLEASAAGSASVVSTTVYGEYVQPGLTAFVAKEPDDWYEAISVLIEQPELRREIARNAHLVARSNFSLSANAYLWHNAYSDFYAAYGGKIKNNLLQLAELKEIQSMDAYRESRGRGRGQKEQEKIAV